MSSIRLCQALASELIGAGISLSCGQSIDLVFWLQTVVALSSVAFHSCCKYYEAKKAFIAFSNVNRPYYAWDLPNAPQIWYSLRLTIFVVIVSTSRASL
jgi:hypothetical protein